MSVLQRQKEKVFLGRTRLFHAFWGISSNKTSTTTTTTNILGYRWSKQLARFA